MGITAEKLAFPLAEAWRYEPADPPDRWNWDAPLVLSPHSATRLYFGSQRLFRSDDRGDSWQAVSPDLTRQLDRILAFAERIRAPGTDAVQATELAGEPIRAKGDSGLYVLRKALHKYRTPVVVAVGFVALLIASLAAISG